MTNIDLILPPVTLAIFLFLSFMGSTTWFILILIAKLHTNHISSKQLKIELLASFGVSILLLANIVLQLIIVGKYIANDLHLVLQAINVVIALVVIRTTYPLGKRTVIRYMIVIAIVAALQYSSVLFHWDYYLYQYFIYGFIFISLPWLVLPLYEAILQLVSMRRRALISK